MAWTQTDLDALDVAIASGHKTVRHADKMVEYRDMAEMLKARDMIAASLQAPTVRRSTLATFERDL